MDRPLMSLAPAEVEQALDDRHISADDAFDYVVRTKLAKGFLDMKPDEVEFALDAGYVQPEQVEAYCDYQESPIRFYAKDLGRGAWYGTKTAAKEMEQAADWMLNWLPELGPDGLDDPQGFVTDPTPGDVRNPEQDTQPEENETPEYYTKLGMVASGGAQFATGFIPFLGVAGKLSKIPKMAALAKSSPKLFEFIRVSIAGMAADTTVFDPHESRLSDLIEHYPQLSNPVTRWLKADPNDSETEGRLKNAIEGLGIGSAADALFMSLRLVKGKLWTSKHNILDDISKQVDENLPGEAAADISEKTSKITEGATKAPDEIVEPRGSQEAVSGPFTPEEADKLAKDLFDLTEGKLPEKELSKDFINFDRIETTDEHKQLLEMIIEKTPRHTPRSQRTTAALAGRKLADLAGTGVEEVNKFVASFAADVKNLDVKINMINRYLVAYDEFIYDLAEKSAEHGYRPFGHEMKVAAHLQQFADLLRTVKGVQVEVGRGLNAYKIMRKGRKFDFDKISDEFLEETMDVTGKQNIKKLVDNYKSLHDSEARAAYAREVTRSRFMQGLTEYRQAALVSSLQTHKVNMLGSLAALSLEAVSRTAATGVMGLIQPWRFKQLAAYYTGMGKGLAEAFYLPGASKLVRGNVKGFKEGFKADWISGDKRKLGKVFQSFLEGEPITDVLTKYDTSLSGGAIPNIPLQKAAQKLGIEPEWWMQIPVGDLVRLPFRFLTAEDEIFKSIGYAAEKNFRAFEMAYNTTVGIKKGWDSFDNEFLNLMKNTPEELHLDALRAAREMTFTNPLRGAWADVGRALSYNPSGGVLGKYALPLFKAIFVPFYNVAVNIALFSGRRTPLGLLSRKFQEDLLAGGIRQAEAVSRISVGTSVMGLGFYLYNTGRITGAAPTGQQDAWRNANIQEYAFWTGEKWIQYNRLDPLAMWLGMAADIHRVYDMYHMPDSTFYEMFSAASLIFADNIGSKTFMKSLSDFMTMMFRGSPGWQERFIKRTGSTFFPFAIAAQNKQVSDDQYLREIYSWEDAFNINVDSTKLLPRRHNVTGQPIVKEPRTFGMFNVTRTTDADRALLDMYFCGANVGRISDKLQGVELEPKQYDQLNAILAKMPIRETLNRVYDNPKFQHIKDDQTRAETYRRIIQIFREGARAAYLAETPEVREKIIAEYQLQANAIRGLTERRHEKTQTYRTQFEQLLGTSSD